MEPKQEGFQESEDENMLASKLKPNLEQENPYFVVPDAKPILSKNVVDLDKAKVLIKEIEFTKQPIELLSSNLSRELLSGDRSHNAKSIPNMKKVESTTIWSKYVMSQSYLIRYLKYYKQDIGDLQKRGFKKLKLELQKLCRYEQNLFSAYIVDLSFLSDVGSYLLRNLKETSFEQLKAKQLLQNEQVRFDSRFECGNLFAVFESKNQKPAVLEYDLVLQSDINTKGYSNWFYFSFQARSQCTLKLNIVNMQKNHSLFPKGMKAVFYSHQKHLKENLGWHHDGYHYAYYPNELLKGNDSNLTYSTLSFEYEVKYANDLIYVAANLPYSYTKLLNYIDSIEKTARLNPNIYFKRENLAASISGNQCPVITLTWKQRRKKEKPHPKKKIIGVIARQHPCETVSSYVMEGLINSLVNLSAEWCVDVLQDYIFKIIPMVNVDGVVYGNSRCDITGSDINRKWTRNPNKFMYPIVSAIRTLFQRLRMEEYEIDYFIDLHGHSRKMGSFIYGCKTFDDIQSRHTAWIMSRLNPKFLFEESSFGLSAYKRETARGIMSEIVVRKKSMTLETSFYGCKTVVNRHHEVKDLHRMGATIIEAVYAESTRDPKLINWESIRNDISGALAAYRSSIRPNAGEKVGSEDSSFGSDSDPEEDEFNMKQKTELFLDPSTVAKIGLNEVKVVKRNDKAKMQVQEQKMEGRLKYEIVVDGSNQKLEAFQHRSISLEPFHASPSERLKQNGKKFVIRQSKSITKIRPFKLSGGERVERTVKNRTSVESFLNRLPQKLSVPELPKVEKKSSFWSSLKKEYEGLVSERRLEGRNKLP